MDIGAVLVGVGFVVVVGLALLGGALAVMPVVPFLLLADRWARKKGEP